MRCRLNQLKTMASVLYCALWLPLILFTAILSAQTVQAEGKPDWLTQAEWSFLQDHKTITIAPDPNFPPIESINKDGSYTGLAADYARLVEEMLGITFKIDRSESWDEVLRKAQSREVDALPAAANTVQRQDYLNFAKPHLVLPGVIIVREQVLGDLTLSDLNGKNVAIVSGYVWQELVEKDHSEIIVVPVSDLKAGLNKVAFGSVDAMIATLPVAIDTIEKAGIHNLRVAGETGFFTSLSFGTRKDWPLLNSIIEKALAQITPDVRKSILSKWVGLYRPEVSFFQTREFKIGLGVALIIITLIVVGAIMWNRSLRKQVTHQTRKFRESEERFREFAESASDWLWEVDADGRYIWQSKSGGNLDGLTFEKIQGMTREEIAGDTMTDETWFTYQNALKRHIDFENFEFCYSGTEGKIHYALINGKALFDDSGRYLGHRGTAKDITNRKHSEEQLLEAKEDAEKANTAKSEFLASMSHELRTPLNAVLGFAQMLEYDTQTPLNTVQKEYINSILQGGNHLLELVNEVLDLAKIEANQLVLNLEDVSVNEITAECIEMTRALGKERGIHVSNYANNCTSTSVILHTDRLRLKQALLNLISNAIKFNKDNGTVTIDCRETDDGFVRISVTDTGAGIAKEDYGSVFHMFHRLGADPMVAQEGTGIGLTVTKLLIERMAGRIGFESDEGVGSTFWLELPLTSQDEAYS